MAVETGNRTDAVYQALRAAIIGGQFQPGEPLRQEDLAQRYGTSRIPVREALRQLEMEGIVTYHPRCGAVVADISLDDALEVMDIRIALECRALQLAIPNMTDSDFERIRKILDSERMSKDLTEWDRMNRNFHMSLYAPSERPLLLGLINSNFDKLEQFAHFHVARATGNERPHREHHEMFEACQGGNIKKAVSVLEAHITYSQKTLAAAERQRKAAAESQAVANQSGPDPKAEKGQRRLRKLIPLP